MIRAASTVPCPASVQELGSSLQEVSAGWQRQARGSGHLWARLGPFLCQHRMGLIPSPRSHRSGEQPRPVPASSTRVVVWGCCGVGLFAWLCVCSGTAMPAAERTRDRTCAPISAWVCASACGCVCTRVTLRVGDSMRVCTPVTAHVQGGGCAQGRMEGLQLCPHRGTYAGACGTELVRVTRCPCVKELLPAPALPSPGVLLGVHIPGCVGARQTG